MARYLAETDALLALRQGRAIEQFLGAREDEGDRVLRWVRCHTEPRGAVVVSVFEVFDEGRPNFTGMVEFAAFDPGEPYGASQSFDTPDEAWAYLLITVGASPTRFVGTGMAGEEYRDFIGKEGWWQRLRGEKLVGRLRRRCLKFLHSTRPRVHRSRLSGQTPRNANPLA